MAEKLCLKWNDFQENLNSTFGGLRKDNDFSDVTLVCEDGHQVGAHKVVLSLSSPFFQNLLKRNQHSHPLIYMRGLNSEDLIAIVDFLYYGEANVNQENLDSFLAIAEELKLKGLTGQNIGEDENQYKSTNPNPNRMTTKEVFKEEHWNPSTKQKHPSIKKDQAPDMGKNNERSLSIPNYFSGDLQDLDEKVKSMMEMSQNKIQDGRSAKICKVCGKEGAGIAIRDHIEANHLEGISLPCNMCGKSFRSRLNLRRHKCIKDSTT